MDQHRRQTLIALALDFCGGVCLPIQAIINGRLGGYPGSPLLASTPQNLVGAIAALLLAVFLGPTRLRFPQLATTPVWAWVGGLCGIVFILAGVIAAPRVGATAMMSAVMVWPT
ncbi:MAG TPA: DMT family transporter [Bryobacteraceae bacterium]|nr:DMT family transporter [Bryobacteraceae bacterium]